MTDEEYVKYMEEHYIKRNENRYDIMKDLNVSEYHFYKRNKQLGIHRENKLFSNKSKYRYDLIKGEWVKND